MANENGKKKSVEPPAPELEVIDSAWDDDSSGEIPIAGLDPESFSDDPYDRVTAVPAVSPSEYVKHAMEAAPESLDPEQKSGVQPREDRMSLRPTPPQGIPAVLQALVTPDSPDAAPEL